MFVQANTLKEISGYFQKELGDSFSSNELKLILKTLYKKRFSGSDTDFLLAQNERLSESDLLFFHSALKRLYSNEPFQYVIGETEFYGLLLAIDERALIPRPETEELVDWIVQSVGTKGEMNVADFCSGSGCIALGLKSVLPQSSVFALEISPEAIELIKENSQLTQLNIKTIECDLLQEVPKDMFSEPLDVIVSNPPYIPIDDKKKMASNVLDFEPDLALFVSNEDPLIFYREIAKTALRLLRDNGWLYFEIHEDLGQEVVALLETLNFVNIELRKDLQNRDRMVRAQMVSFAL